MKKLLSIFMAVMVMVCSAVPCFAVSTSDLPEITDSMWNKEAYPYAYLLSSDGSTYDVIFAKLPARYDNDKFVVQKVYSGYGYTRWTYSGDAWDFVTQSASSISFDFSSLKESNIEVVDANGTSYFYPDGSFFPSPLWETVGQVTQGEMANLTAEMVGMMKVLVPCGVGLMALLVVLSLFGKRYLLFLR